MVVNLEGGNARNIFTGILTNSERRGILELRRQLPPVGVLVYTFERRCSYEHLVRASFALLVPLHRILNMQGGRRLRRQLPSCAVVVTEGQHTHSSEQVLSIATALNYTYTFYNVVTNWPVIPGYMWNLPTQH